MRTGFWFWTTAVLLNRERTSRCLHAAVNMQQYLNCNKQGRRLQYEGAEAWFFIERRNSESHAITSLCEAVYLEFPCRHCSGHHLQWYKCFTAVSRQSGN